MSNNLNEPCASGFTNGDFESLLIISQFYWPEPIGTPFYVTDFAQWMAEKGKKVSVITGRPYYPEFRLMPGYERGKCDNEFIEGVSIYRLPTYVPEGGKASKRVVNELYYFFGVLMRLLTRRISRCRHVVSFCPTILTVLLGWLATKRGGRHVAIVHDIQSGLAAGLRMLRCGFFFSVFQWVEKFCLNKADHIVVLSEQMRKALRKLGVRQPISVIPIWVDEKAIYPKLKKSGSQYTLLYSGNLGRKQGLHHLLDLAEILDRERPEVRLLIRGNGSQKSNLMDSVKERGLKNIEFEPLLPLEKFNNGLADGDIHLVPQSPNAADFAIPSKIYSIMAAGRPIVATALKGSALWDMQGATEGAIICVTPNDPKEFSDSVIKLLDEEKLREEMGRKGRRYINSVASRDIVLSRYASLLTGEVQA